MSQEVVGSLWDEVPCTIETFEISDEPNKDRPFTAKVRYTYLWEGKKYESSTLHAGNEEERSEYYEDLAAYQQQYLVEETPVCFVNPDNPTESALLGGRPWFLLIALVPLSFAAFGVGIFISGLRSRGKAKALTPTSKENKGAWVGIPFFGLFAAAGSAAFYFLTVAPLTRYSESKSWTETECEIVWSRVRMEDGDDGGRTYRPDIFYRYTYGGLVYHSNTIGLFKTSSSGRDSKQKTVDAHPPGHRGLCFVDPNNPTRALLDSSIGWKGLFFLFPLPFLAIGFGGLYVTLFHKTKLPDKKGRQKILTKLKYRGRATFSPGKKRVYKVLGAVFACLPVAVLTAVTGWAAADKPDGDTAEKVLSVACALMALLTLWMGVRISRSVLALFNPAPALTLTPGHLPVGGAGVLSWHTSGNVGKLENLKIRLSGKECATYRSGKSTYTKESIFYDREIGTVTTLSEIRSGETRIAIPPDTVPSLDARNNKIFWQLTVAASIPSFPDIEDTYKITVVPE